MGKLYLYSRDPKQRYGDRARTWIFDTETDPENRAHRGDGGSKYCEQVGGSQTKGHPDVPPGKCGEFRFVRLLPEGKDVLPAAENPKLAGFTRMFLTSDDDGSLDLWITQGEAPSYQEEMWNCEGDDTTVLNYTVGQRCGYYDPPVKPGEGVELTDGLPGRMLGSKLPEPDADLREELKRLQRRIEELEGRE